MKIVTICGMGVGTSVIAKMNVENLLKKLNLDGDVQSCDLGSVTSTNADIYVTTKEIYETLPDSIKSKTIQISNFVVMKEVEEALIPVLKK
ncbi:phosphotransferase system lactose/cellobiose-specific IIB subunit [Thermoanaerobacterium xylanolyticum LX-11]|uniref:Phosphotransferase system lactose/cellobiose-specific IIB subunit n=1 Tax=Thermoanaerobacterium xylanolyticum (strain ATCC 49914 / DSM 7097 / LX-11) TaxID=858215 RepID=F6BKR3_THEXL|nr:PTS sugar transporter subunit IIB [Thermoanaerobacterium xylanolyticum]AEF18146.1 phosphotransferase system lactose/cellobiose-specific IIB subunit [Thermoanaerobacterium xylanolyticum LX-11]